MKYHPRLPKKTNGLESEKRLPFIVQEWHYIFQYAPSFTYQYSTNLKKPLVNLSELIIKIFHYHYHVSHWLQFY